MDTNEAEAKSDEVQSKPPAFDCDMIIVCLVLEIKKPNRVVMRNMRCFATVNDTIKACNIIIQRHQLDQRLSEQTWSKLLAFTKWRAKNQDTAINEFDEYYDDYTVDGEKLDDNILYILRKIEATHGDRRKQDKIFTMIDLQKIDEETVNKKKRPAQEKENPLLQILRKIEEKQDKMFTMIDLQKIDEETVNTKKRPAQEKENSLSKKRNQPKREESNPALKEKIHNMNNSTLSDLAARNLMDTNKPETKRDEVPSKRPVFDDEMLVVCCALEITPQEKTTMRNMVCFDTVDRTIKACNLIIRRHQLDERLSAWTWSKLLRFSKWRAKNQDAAISDFYSIMVDKYLRNGRKHGRKLDDDILYITRKRLQSPTGGIMQGKVFTVIDLQKIERPAFGYENDLTDDIYRHILSYAADGNIVSRLCELQLISHKWYDIVMSETCSSESWDMAFKQKFSCYGVLYPGSFDGPYMHTRNDCMNFWPRNRLEADLISVYNERPSLFLGPDFWT